MSRWIIGLIVSIVIPSLVGLGLLIHREWRRHQVDYTVQAIQKLETYGFTRVTVFDDLDRQFKIPCPGWYYGRRFIAISPQIETQLVIGEVCCNFGHDCEFRVYATELLE